MANNNVQETLKKYFYSGVGLAAHTAEVVQKSVNELVKKGKVSETDGKKIVADAIKKVEARRPEIEAKYNEAVHKRVEQLEKQLTVKKAGVAKPAAKPVAKPVAKKKVAAKKKVVKKAAPATPSAPIA